MIVKIPINIFRAYNPQVRVGNWNEDICLEEDLLNGKEFSIMKDTVVTYLFRLFGEES